MDELTNMMIFTHKSVKMTQPNCLIFAIDVELDFYNSDLIQFFFGIGALSFYTCRWKITPTGEELHVKV